MQAVKCFVRTIGPIREDTFAKSGEKVMSFFMLFIIGAPRLRFPGHLPPIPPWNAARLKASRPGCGVESAGGANHQTSSKWKNLNFQSSRAEDLAYTTSTFTWTRRDRLSSASPRFPQTATRGARKGTEYSCIPTISKVSGRL